MVDQLTRLRHLPRVQAGELKVKAVGPEGYQCTFVLYQEGIVNLLTKMPGYRLVTVEPLEVEVQS